METTILQDLDIARKSQDESLSHQDLKKITDYYAYAVPAILGEGFCILRGTKMTIKERTSLTYLGAITGLFDDFFDEKGTNENHIKELISNPSEAIAEDSHELLFVRCYLKALESAPNQELLKKVFNEVHIAQVLSLKQTSKSITKEEIKSITLQKGGISLLFYRSVLEGKSSTEEETMLYTLGGLMQLENDTFDIYKDHRQKIKTLSTTETNMNHLRGIYTGLMDETSILIHQLKYSSENKTYFHRFISMITLRGLVCLDELEKNEKLTNNQFKIESYSRKQLICDMESLSNALKVLHYYSKSSYHQVN